MFPSLPSFPLRFVLCGAMFCLSLSAEEAESDKTASPEKKAAAIPRIYPAIYQRPAGNGREIKARFIGDDSYRRYSSNTRLSPYRYRYDYGRPDYYSNHSQGYGESYDAIHDFGDPGSWYQQRSYGYTSRYPFSSTQVPAYRYPFSREYYSYGPGYSNYGYAFGYPYGWYGGWYPGWYGGFGYWGYSGAWGGPWFPYKYW